MIENLSTTARGRSEIACGEKEVIARDTKGMPRILAFVSASLASSM
jgi:hypothetical protein